MRVLHIIPSISPLRGGPSQAVLSMVGALRGQGVDARILTTNDHGTHIQPAMPLYRWHTVSMSGHEIPVIAFPRWNPPAHALREFCISTDLIDWLSRFSSEYNLVHVHALFSYTTSMAMVRLRRQGTPYILRTIGQLNSWSLTQSRLRKKLFLSLFDQANINGASALHFTSEFERRESSRLTGTAYNFVLPLGVQSLELEASTLAHDSRREAPPSVLRFLYLSRIHPKKQLPLLFEALHRLRVENPARDWQLDIAGDGDADYVDYLQRLTENLGISDLINWHGHVAGLVKQSLLVHSDWFILPSFSENFGISVVESLGVGTPVILTPGVAVAEDVVKYGAGIVSESTVDALSQCLQRCLDPPDAFMQKAAKRLAEERYSWPSICKNLIIEYEKASQA
jgi:glycosyltransferase involved in cell wall biosynthesis